MAREIEGPERRGREKEGKDGIREPCKREEMGELEVGLQGARGRHGRGIVSRRGRHPAWIFRHGGSTGDAFVVKRKEGRKEARPSFFPKTFITYAQATMVIVC